MADSLPLPIVVGIDGSDTGARALHWAAAEADRRGRPLTIVHGIDVGERIALSEATVIAVLREVGDYGREVVADAVATVKDAHVGVAVTTVLRQQQAQQLLVELSETAGMLVVGSHGGGRFVGALLGSVSQHVAAHAHCPVVVVNDAAEPRSDQPVVVGVSPSPGGIQALRFAFEEARSRGAELLAIRSYGDVQWISAGLGYSVAIFDDWRRIAATTLQNCLDGVRSQYPDVTVQVELSGEGPEQALLSACEHAGLLVVGCRYEDERRFSRLGPTASWLLHRAPCPIVVVGRRRVHDPAASADRDAVPAPAAS